MVDLLVQMFDLLASLTLIVIVLVQSLFRRCQVSISLLHALLALLKSLFELLTFVLIVTGVVKTAVLIVAFAYFVHAILIVIDCGDVVVAMKGGCEGVIRGLRGETELGASSK